MGMAELNLSSLPLDIIRLIIRANVGERTENMRMISKTWNVLINEYYEKLPPLCDLYLNLRKNKPYIWLSTNKKHRTYFEKNLFREIIIKKFDNELVHTYVKFSNFESTAEFFSRIFHYTNKISKTYFDFVDSDNIENVVKCMRNIEIEGCAIFDNCNQNVRLTLEKMCLRHKTNTFAIYSRNTLAVHEWGDFIRNVSNSMPIVYIFLKEEEPDDSKRNWKNFGQDLIAKKSTNEVNIFTGISEINFFREPWMEIFYSFKNCF